MVGLAVTAVLAENFVTVAIFVYTDVYTFV